MYRRVDAVDDVEAQAATCTKAHRQQGKTRHGTRIEQHDSQAWIRQMWDVHGDILVLQQHLSDHLLEVEVGTCDLDTANNKEAAKHAITLRPIGATPDRKFSVHVRTLLLPNTASLIATQNSRTSEHRE